MNFRKDENISYLPTNRISINDYYYSYLNDISTKAYKTDENYFWIKFESFSTVRFPELDTTKPTEKEVNNIFKKIKCLLLSYTILPDKIEDANAFLYNCTNNNYIIENLIKNVRRDIRYSQRNLSFGFTNWGDLLANGFKAFSDTRTRVGLSDGTEKNFNKRFSDFSKNPAHKVVAARLGNEIAAFMSLIVVDDFVIIQGSFSTNEHKKLCPNNGLADFVLNYFLKENGFRLVCYGLSSIQENTGKEGLHSYKIRIGFEAIPVKRVFIFHPLIAPFKGIINFILHNLLVIFPHNRAFKKASGILESLKHQLD